MKKTIFLISLCISSMMLFAQNDHYNRSVPPEVQRSYQKDYPDYYNNNTTWDMRNNQWHTRYRDRDRNRDVDVYYDRRGRRIYSQYYWDRNDLPVAVRERIRRRYHYDNYNVYRMERPGRGIYFQITLGGNRRVYLDERGREVRF
jgi:hypothetical protein